MFKQNGFGGAIKISRFIYDSLEKSGFNIKALSIRSHTDGSGHFDGVKYNKTQIPKLGFDPFYIRRINFFKSIINELDVDLVICTCHEYNFLIAFAAKSLGIKCIISEHGNHLLTRGIKKKILRYFAYRSAEFVTLLTKFDMDFFSGHKNIVQMYNPVNLKIPLDLPQKENIVLFVGSINNGKRLDFLIRAFAMLKDELKNSYRIVVCGDGVNRDECENLAKELGINLNIFGFVKDIEKYYAKAKVLASTSSSEGLSLALIEPIAFDCTRISTKAISGPEELIRDGYDGFLSEVDDVKEFSKKLEILLKDDKLRIKMAQNAKKRIGEFAPEYIAQKWVNLVKSALKI